MNYSLKIRKSEYKELFPDVPIKGISGLFCSYFLIKREFNKSDGFSGAQEELDYSYDGVIKLNLISFFILIIPLFIINLFYSLWAVGLKNFPKITRVLVLITVDRGFLGFSKIDSFWGNKHEK